ncbi:MAG: DUF4199 domain-containing protein [Gilvibacter sp.]
MNKTVLKFGLYALLSGALVFSAALLFGKSFPSSIEVAFGYATMIIAVSFAYFGIKAYRDKENNGTITFKKALGIGVLISVFAGVGIGLIDALFTSIIYPDFAVEYAASLKEQGYEGEPPIYSSAQMALLMFVTVMIVGIIVSIISAMILKTPQKSITN